MQLDSSNTFASVVTYKPDSKEPKMFLLETHILKQGMNTDLAVITRIFITLNEIQERQIKVEQK